MVNVFVLIWLLSLLAAIIGFIKPQWLKLASRKMVLWVCGGVAFVSLIGIGATAPPTKVEQQIASNPVLVEATSTQSKDVANSDVVINSVATNKSSSSTIEKATTETAVITPTNNQEDVAKTDTTLYTVASVVDGDTLKITMNGKSETLRLIGMDTPEVVDPRKTVQCFGKEASNKAKELLSGKKISIETDPSQGERDKYGRLLVYVRRSDGLFYNQYMIEQGYAHEYTYNVPYKYQLEFKAAQKAAQEAQRGLWSPTTCNGDTTQAATQPTPTVQPAPTITTNDQPAQAASSGKYYTSSHYKATRYYPEACDAWKSLSPSYLKVFNSLSALLAAYPDRTLSPECN